MPKITMTKGLPASGKSTWARAQVMASSGQTKRVNMDLLREMFDAGEWTKGNEKFMQAQRERLIEECLLSGKNVIVDDTNLHPKHESMLRGLATLHRASFAIQDFTDVSVEECIRRDLLRPVSVGEKVIRKMARDYLEVKTVSVDPPEWINGKPLAIIIDLDGTTALMNGRGPYDYDRVGGDRPNTPVIRQVREWAKVHVWGAGNGQLIFCSGRPDTAQCRIDTERWIKEHVIGGMGLSKDIEWTLLMRPEFLHDPKRAANGQEMTERDFRNDAIVKKEIYDKYIKGNFNVDFVLDDRDRVVEMWRQQGLLCLQVAPGSF